MVVPYPIDRDAAASVRPIPMTREAFDRLESELERLTRALPAVHDAAVVARGEDDDTTLALPATWELQRHQQQIEALRRLRADERTASMRILALTAQAMEGDRERFLAAGFDGYLSKPVDIAEFVATVRRHCTENGS